MTLSAGMRLGPYEILAPLGAGGMGEVYRARDTRLGREVAIKVPPEHLARDPDALARFEREARAVAALSHPNILEIHDVGHEAGLAFAVTELLSGETLRQRLRGTPLPWREASETGLAIAEGLAAAHSRGVTHRDLKPENVFLTSDGRVKILDFGLARIEPQHAPGDSATNRWTTETGTLLGTVGYMSPEQVRGQKSDSRTDIFSLGCILYEMATGRRAFSRETGAETLVAILKDDPSSPRELVPGLPEALDRTISRCLAKEPERRIQSARDLGFALKDVLASGASLPSAAALPRRRRVALIAAAGAVALAVGSLLLRKPAAAPVFSGVRSLAVLPFSNATGDTEAQYFSDGVSESLINTLSQQPRLRVLARTTSFQFRGKDPRRAGQELKVEAVLTGSISTRADRFLLQADLIEVSDGSQIWGRRFDERRSGIFGVEEGIAQQISQSLLEKLTPEEKQRLAKRHTADPEAYDLYLRGRYWWARRSDEGYEKSLQFFEKAVARDPNYALAWVGLSDVLDALMYYGAVPPLPDVLPRARAAVRRALELDGTLAEAHASLATSLYQFDWDWAGAERGFRRALSLNPDYATGHQWYSNYLSCLGRFEEASREIREARKLDPLNLVINTDVGMAYHMAGDDSRAIEVLRQTTELDPQFGLARVYLALALLGNHDETSAIAELRQAMALLPGSPDPVALYGYACARAGRRAEALEALAQLESLSRKRFVSALPFAVLHLGLENRDAAFEWLDKAYEERAGRLVYVNVEEIFAPIRSDPRFRDLSRRLKFPVEAIAGK